MILMTVDPWKQNPQSSCSSENYFLFFFHRLGAFDQTGCNPPSPDFWYEKICYESNPINCLLISDEDTSIDNIFSLDKPVEG